MTLVEADRAAAQVIRKNMAGWGADEQLEVLECTVEHARGALSQRGPIDLVLADPPWKVAGAAALSVARTVHGLLATDARVVLGHPAREALSLDAASGLLVVSCRTWGDSALSFLTPRASSAAGTAVPEAGAP